MLSARVKRNEVYDYSPEAYFMRIDEMLLDLTVEELYHQECYMVVPYEGHA